MGLTINGVRCHGVMLKQRDHYIYAYVPDSIIFQTLLQNVIMCLFIYLIVVVLIWMIYRKLQKKEAISGKGISPTNTSGYKYYCAAGVLAGC